MAQASNSLQERLQDEADSRNIYDQNERQETSLEAKLDDAKRDALDSNFQTGKDVSIGEGIGLETGGLGALGYNYGSQIYKELQKGGDGMKLGDAVSNVAGKTGEDMMKTLNKVPETIQKGKEAYSTLKAGIQTGAKTLNEYRTGIQAKRNALINDSEAPDKPIFTQGAEGTEMMPGTNTAPVEDADEFESLASHINPKAVDSVIPRNIGAVADTLGGAMSAGRSLSTQGLNDVSDLADKAGGAVARAGEDIAEKGAGIISKIGSVGSAIAGSTAGKLIGKAAFVAPALDDIYQDIKGDKIAGKNWEEKASNIITPISTALDFIPGLDIAGGIGDLASAGLSVLGEFEEKKKDKEDTEADDKQETNAPAPTAPVVNSASTADAGGYATMGTVKQAQTQAGSF